MNNFRKGLGQGLSSLISSDSHDLFKKGETNSNISLPLSCLKTSSFQPRKTFEQDSLEELAASIRANGIISPIVVRKCQDDGKYEIIAGERRWRAAKIANSTKVPVAILDINDKTALEISIIENVQRENLNAIEEAEGYKKLMEEFLYTHEDLSEIIGKSRSHISNMIRLISLPESVKSLLQEGKITMGHARALINVREVNFIVEQIMSRSLNVRQTEELVRSIQKRVKKTAVESTKKKKEKSKEIIMLEDKLSETLGFKVIIQENEDEGLISIQYCNVAELEKILEKLTSL